MTVITGRHTQKCILITGGTGLIGSHLASTLRQEGHQVRLLSSNKVLAGKNPDVYYWSVDKKALDIKAIEGVQVIFNLAGESIAGGLWTKKRKGAIMNSRVDGTNLLLERVVKAGLQLETYFGASAVGYYGSCSNDMEKSEQDAKGEGFLADVCTSWEEAHLKFKRISDKVVIGRLGNVLSNEGGFTTPFRFISKSGIGFLMGKRQLRLPWVHVDDVVRFMSGCLSMSSGGVYNLVAASTDWKLLQTAIYRSFGAKILIPVPPLLLRLGMGSMSSLLLDGCAVSGQKIRESGFEFQFKDLDQAVS